MVFRILISPCLLVELHGGSSVFPMAQLSFVILPLRLANMSKCLSILQPHFQLSMVHILFLPFTAGFCEESFFFPGAPYFWPFSFLSNSKFTHYFYYPAEMLVYACCFWAAGLFLLFVCFNYSPEVELVTPCLLPSQWAEHRNHSLKELFLASDCELCV